MSIACAQSHSKGLSWKLENTVSAGMGGASLRDSLDLDPLSIFSSIN